MSLTRRNLNIADDRPDVFFALSLETSCATLAEMENLYQVAVDLALEHFACPSTIHAAFLAESNLDLARIDAASGTDDDVEHLSGRVAELYGRIPVLDIKRIAKVAPRAEPKRNSVEHLLLGGVERVVTWPEYDVGRISRCDRVLNGFRNANEPVANIRTDVNEFPGALACFAGLPLPMGVSLPPLMTLATLQRKCGHG